jgi:hypothetical protein
MKKLIIILSVFILLASVQQVFAYSVDSNSYLTFENVTNTSAVVRFNPGYYGYTTSDYNNYSNIKIQYRPWACGDDSSNQICPAIYMVPSTATFNYTSNGSLPTLTLTNLLPNTRYRVWLGSNNSNIINCIQAPCYGYDTWQDKIYSFTTLSVSSYPYPYPNPIPDPYPYPTPYPTQILTQKLYFGVRGTQVNILENFLASQGYMNTYIDTYFGTVTYAAMIRFQTVHGLTADGVVGPMTRSVINQILSSSASYNSVAI